MFEARLPQADVWKKVIDAIKELVQEATIDCSDTGISLQAMDSAHVSLVSLLLRSDGFETFRCDRNMSLGLNISRFVWVTFTQFVSFSAAKILKCAGSSDSITLKAGDKADTITFLFESRSKELFYLFNQIRSGKGFGLRAKTYGFGCRSSWHSSMR